MKTNSIILTVHNKGFLLNNSLERIKKLTKGFFELIIVIDGCTDNSEEIATTFKNTNKNFPIQILFADDVFETKANNLGMKAASGDYIIIIQDDMLVNEEGWNLRLTKPFSEFSDVFGVTANCAHNWIFNPKSKHILMNENLNNCRSDVLIDVDHSGKHWGLQRDVFAVRDSANRGPLALNHQDLKTMDYLDEIFSPLDMDDHDLCYRVKKRLNKVVGCYWIDFISDFAWGGTRENGQFKPWFYEANQKNTKLLWERHSDIMTTSRKIENRKLK